jgi:hypothetical protein
MLTKNQVCTFQQAKKLKELGVDQFSLAAWTECGTGIKVDQLTVIPWDSEMFAAFNAAELGVMLRCDVEPILWDKRKETEATARAKTLIFLLQHHLISIHDINKLYAKARKY